MFYVTAGVVLLLAIFQNFYRLARPPLLVDEPQYAQMGWLYLHWSTLGSNARKPAATNWEHPPLAKILFGLAQVLVGHQSISAARAVGATCTVLTAVVLAGWLAHSVDRWLGLLAGAMFALEPMSVAPAVTRVGRTSMLDPVAELFMVCSVVLAWYWFRTPNGRGWLLAFATGTATGLATASKENGFLGVIGPVCIGMALSCRSRRAFTLRSVQVICAAAVALAFFVCCYLPFGDEAERIKYLYDFQRSHSHSGHLIGLAGRLTFHPPWWANLWFAEQGLGSVLAWFLVAAGTAAILLRRDRLVAWCVGALVVPVVFHCFIAGVALVFYWAMFMPAVIVLAALGSWEVGRRARRPGPGAYRLCWLALTVTAAVVTLVPALSQTRTVATLPADGAVAVQPIRAKLKLTGSVLVTGLFPAEIAPRLPAGTPVMLHFDERYRSVDTVVIGQPRCRTIFDRTIRAFVAANVSSGTMVLARSDRLVRIYVAVGPLHAPSAVDVRNQRPVPLSDHC